MSRALVPPPASTRPRAAATRVLGLVALAASACSLSQNGVTPPADTFFYPTGAIMNPTDTAGNWLFVANSNADLRFNDGTLLMVNVGSDPTLGTMSAAAYDRTQFWPQCPQEDYVTPLPRSDAPICCRDLLDSNIINCDERRYTAADATVSIGSFSAGMVWQPFCNLPGVFQDTNNATDTQPCQPDPSQPLVEQPGRILIGVRGDTSLTDVDVAPSGTYTNAAPRPAFHCVANALELTPTLAECDQKIQEQGPTAEVLNVLAGDTSTAAVSLPDEPYALALDPTGNGFLYVGALVGNTSTQDSGGVSLFDASGVGVASPPEFPFPAPPQFLAPFGSPFPANSSGQFGITNLHIHEGLGSPPDPPNTPPYQSNKRIWASSRYVPLVSTMTVIGQQGQNSAIQDTVVVPAGDTLSSGLAGSEMRGVEFIEPPLTNLPPGSPTLPPNSLPTFASRAFALQRVLPALVGFDIARSNDGALTSIPTDVIETCSSPTFLYQYPPPQLPEPPPSAPAVPLSPYDATPDNPTRLFINCFDTGEVYVVDPSIPSLITTLMVGRGPAGMFFDKYNQVAYVLNFTQNNVVVMDLAPGSPTQYHVIQRLGFPTVTPR
jgi:DNA-binding beta-propeller fold protein YncE